MSVVPLKMLTVTGPEASIDHVICTCLVNEQFHPVEAAHVTGSVDSIPYEWQNSWQEPLGQAEKLLTELDIPLELRDFRSSGLTMDQAKDYLANVTGHLQEMSSRRSELQERIRCNHRDVEDLEKFSQLPSRLEDIYHLDYVRVRFGRMPKESYDSLVIKAAQIEELILYPTETEKEYAYLIYVAPKASVTKADSFMNALGFERMRLTSHTGGTAGQTVQMLEEDNLHCQQELDALEKDLGAFTSAEHDKLLDVYSYVRFMYGAGEIRKYAVHGPDNTFTLCGWTPESDVETLRERFSAFPDVILTDDSPGSVKGDTPPVLLKNNFWGKLFQPFTEMYGLPAYDEFDPTFMMAVTYSILFGIMYGDVGQGLVLIALGAFLYKKKGLWLGGILGSVGVFSTIFGAVLIVMMMIINIVNGIRQKDLKKIFFTNNSLAGLVFYLAVIIGAVIMLTTGHKVFTTAYIIVFIVLPIILMFCQEPLSKLLQRRKDWKPESIGSFIAENFFEMFEVLLSYVTNTVSFLRVGAYAICHAGMMLVVYTLAGDPANPVVLVLGNIIVMGIEGLLVCIQVLRLEFYEMFGRFYTSGGKKFQSNLIDCKKQIDI